MIKDKVAVITGGGTGIGAATAKLLAGSGVKIVIIGRREKPLNKVVLEIEAKGGTALALPGDVTNFTRMEEIVQETLNRFGRIDMVMPNASITDISSIHSGDPEWWSKVINVNVVGLMNTVRAFLPGMIEQANGHFIVMSSLSGRITYVGEPIYSTSKHAQVAFIETLRKEVTSKGIKVSIVEPGMVDTPLIDNPFAHELQKTVPPLEAIEVAEAVQFIFTRGDNCTINELSMRPSKQEL